VIATALRDAVGTARVDADPGQVDPFTCTSGFAGGSPPRLTMKSATDSAPSPVFKLVKTKGGRRAFSGYPLP
jgi:hypothetical protein